MKAKDWIEVVKADLVTESEAKKPMLEGVLAVCAELISACLNADIEPQKTIQGAYEMLYSYASRNREGNACYIPQEKAKELLSGYLGLQNGMQKSLSKNLVDFDEFF